MPFYKDYIYPYLVDILGDPPPIQKVRRQIIPQHKGWFSKLAQAQARISVITIPQK